MHSDRRATWVPVAVLLIGLGPSACKKSVAGTTPPRRDVRSWSLTQIEAELERNGDVLSDAGIQVAMVQPPTLTEPPGPAANDDSPVWQEDDGGDADAPDVEPGPMPESEPEPEPEPEPMPMPAPAEAAPPAYDYEQADSMDLAAEAPARRVRRQRRRASSRTRSRRSRNRGEDPPTRCERICELAESTCDLEAQICELAERHPDEPRYEQACLGAEQQCAAASEACERCEE